MHSYIKSIKKQINPSCKPCKQCGIECSSLYFQQKFDEWTSGNDDIDRFIQETQLSAHNNTDNTLEWIPYQRFENFNYIKKDEFGKMYKAKWIAGKTSHWDDCNQNWSRKNQNIIVSLKSLDNLKNISLDFMNKV